MSNRPIRVNGLANIATLLSHNPDAFKVQAPIKKPDAKKSRDEICQRTIGNLLGLTVDRHQGVMRRIIEAAVREAYNAGHADTLDQNNMVEQLLDQQYKARTELTLPAAAAGIMEQIGMSELLIDLDALSTVFKRNRIEFTVHDKGTEGLPVNSTFIDYRLVPLTDDRVEIKPEG